MLWYWFWMLHNSLVVINNVLAFAYVNMHFLVQKVMEGPADRRMFWWNVGAARLQCWFSSHPDCVLQVYPGSGPTAGCATIISRVYLLPYTIWCTFSPWQIRPWFFCFLILFFYKGEKSTFCTFHLLWKGHTPFWVYTVFVLTVCATVSDSDGLCDHILFHEQGSAVKVPALSSSQ